VSNSGREQSSTRVSHGRPRLIGGDWLRRPSRNGSPRVPDRTGGRPSCEAPLIGPKSLLRGPSFSQTGKTSDFRESCSRSCEHRARADTEGAPVSCGPLPGSPGIVPDYFKTAQDPDFLALRILLPDRSATFAPAWVADYPVTTLPAQLSTPAYTPAQTVREEAPACERHPAHHELRGSKPRPRPTDQRALPPTAYGRAPEPLS